MMTCLKDWRPEVTINKETEPKTDQGDKSNCKNMKHAWNPWTKTTILKTSSFFCGLLPHNFFVALDPFSRICLPSPSKGMKFEFTMAEWYTFVKRSTIIIGTSRGSPNIYISWSDRLLICMRFTYVINPSQPKL